MAALGFNSFARSIAFACVEVTALALSEFGLRMA
jgi:hypothetical protein